MSSQPMQQQPIIESPGPGGEMMSGKAAKEAEGVALGLGQGLQPSSTLSKSQMKKQRKHQIRQQSQSQPSIAQHYKEKMPMAESKQEQVGGVESFKMESTGEQRFQSQPTVAESMESAQLQKESPIIPSAPKQEISLEPPLVSPGEKRRMEQARKEVERLEEKERQDRIMRAERENLPYKAQKEAMLVVPPAKAASGSKIVGQRKRISSYEQEEAEIEAARAAQSEASLIGTVIDEEEERARRIAEDYPTFTEPLEKTKAMEEIERTRRLHSKAEKNRQMMAASCSAKLFPNAPRAFLPENKLWNPATQLLRRDVPMQSFYEKHKKEPYTARYGQFIATTTKTTSTHVPTSSHAPTIAQSKSFVPPGTTLPVSRLVASTAQSPVKTTILETGDVVNYAQRGQETKVCKETYRSQGRPRLVVRHSGLSGKWARHTETVELHEGVDF